MRCKGDNREYSRRDFLVGGKEKMRTKKKRRRVKRQRDWEREIEVVVFSRENH